MLPLVISVSFSHHLSFQLGLCENFLRVAEIVLSWNFEIHRFPIRITFANESTPAAALRPPSSWKEIFQSEDFLRLFFEVLFLCENLVRTLTLIKPFTVWIVWYCFEIEEGCDAWAKLPII